MCSLQREALLPVQGAADALQVVGGAVLVVLHVGSWLHAAGAKCSVATWTARVYVNWRLQAWLQQSLPVMQAAVGIHVA